MTTDRFNYRIRPSRDIDVEALEKDLLGQPDTSSVTSLTVTSSSTATGSALTAGQLYMFQSDIACYIDIAETPTATSSTLRLAANVPYHWTLLSAYKVAALRIGDDDGVLQITPIVGAS